MLTASHFIYSLFPWQASLSVVDLTRSPQTKIRIVLASDLNCWAPLPRAGPGVWSCDDLDKSGV